MPMKPQAPDSAVEEDCDQDGEHHADHADGLVLPRQISRRPGLDGAGDFLHAGIAGVLGENPPSSPESVCHGREAADERQYQRRIACHFFLLRFRNE
jgi:hypothetical protein